MEVIDIVKKIDINKNGSKVDVLFNELSNLIINGQLQANVTFPNENTMCELLSIGRGTLREVYKLLEVKGFITRSKSGTRINDISNIALKGTFDSSLYLGNEKDIVEFLMIIEPCAVGLASQHISEAELDEVYKVMIQLEEANHQCNIEKMIDYNLKFHDLILNGCHNPVIISSVKNSKKRFSEVIIRPLITDSEESKKFMNLCLLQHYNLFYALKTQDYEKCVSIMKNHFLTDLNYLKQNNRIDFPVE